MANDSKPPTTNNSQKPPVTADSDDSKYEFDMGTASLNPEIQKPQAQKPINLPLKTAEIRKGVTIQYHIDLDDDKETNQFKDEELKTKVRKTKEILKAKDADPKYGFEFDGVRIMPNGLRVRTHTSKPKDADLPSPSPSETAILPPSNSSSSGSASSRINEGKKNSGGNDIVR